MTRPAMGGSPVLTRSSPESSGGSGWHIADAAMLLTVSIWMGNNLIVKGAVEMIDPLAYVAGRFALVALPLFLYLLLRGVSLKIAPRDWLWIMLAGVSGFAIYNALFTVALAKTSAFSTALLVALGPVFTLLLAWLLRMERVRLGQWLGIALASAGVAVFFVDKLVDSAPVLGDTLSLIAAMVWAIYSLGGRPLAGRYPALVITAWASVVGLLVILPLSWRPILAQDWIGIGWVGWGALIYSSMLSMLVGYTLWSWAIGQRGVGRTVAYLYLVPIGTGVAAAFVFGETFGAIKIIGAALALAGLALTRRLGGRRLLRRSVTLETPPPGGVEHAPHPARAPSTSPGP